MVHDLRCRLTRPSLQQVSQVFSLCCEDLRCEFKRFAVTGMVQRQRARHLGRYTWGRSPLEVQQGHDSCWDGWEPFAPLPACQHPESVQVYALYMLYADIYRSGNTGIAMLQHSGMRA